MATTIAFLKHRSEILTVEDYEKMPVETLLELARETLSVIADNWVRVGRIFCALKSKGADLSDFPISQSVLEVIMRVGRGEAIADVVDCWSNRPGIMRKISYLPVEKQREIVEKQAVEVYEKIDGKPTCRMIPIEALNREQAKLVFDDHSRRLRTPDEQAIMLNGEEIVKLRRSTRVEIRYDETTETVTVSGPVPFKELEKFVRETKAKRRGE